MNADDIRHMFEGISDNTKEVIARKLRIELGATITAINKMMAADNTPREQLSPQPEMIFNAFRLCDLSNVKVVLLGQDPYINPGEAMGLSFSVPKGKKIPPSLRNIFACLAHHGLIRSPPEHGDLSNWARQGVLLLNAALTTRMRKSYAHANAWETYTNALIREISNLPRQLIFILFGTFATAKAELIDKRRHVILEWGHPSPLNKANQSDNPKNFKYCNVFTRVNDMLILRGAPPINWDPDADTSAAVPTLNEARQMVAREEKSPLESPHIPTYITRETGSDDPVPLTINTLWLFTDGGSRGNGKKNCRSSWAFYITDGCTVVIGHGVVKETNIPGEVYKSSNNRGELTALMNGLDFISHNLSKFTFDDIKVVSDSEYSINCLDKWASAWFANPAKHKLSEKKNLDLIVPAKEALDCIRTKTTLVFQHVNSHLVEPRETDTEEWFIWKCNDIVDKQCNIALGRKVK